MKALWGSYSFEIESVDGPSVIFGKGGSHITAAAGSGEFIVENALSELDEVGEYIHDAASGKIYLGLPRGTARTVEMELTLAQLARVVAVVGTRDTPVRNVTLSGLTVAHTQSTRLSQPYESPSNGDWAIVRTGAVFGEGVEGLTVERCRFLKTGSYGVMISGHARDVTVSDNVFWLTGESAVVIAGEYAAGVVSSATDHFPLRTTVRGNYCYHPGVNNLQSSIFFQALAVQSHVLHNVCFDGPRMAFQLNDQMGGGTVVEGNVAWSMVMETQVRNFD